MSLWIRSQDKTKLLKCEGLELALDEISIYASNHKKILGTYNSKERALEILDEIEKIFCFKYENKNYHEMDLLLKANMLSKFYKMPKE